MPVNEKLVSDVKSGEIIYFPDAHTAVKQTIIYDMIYFAVQVISLWVCYLFYDKFHLELVSYFFSKTRSMANLVQ